ncbi:MAG: ribosome maturation factor RimM [Gemmatimonadota bacterium]
MDEGARRLVVGRVRKPHGLKGDCAIFPLTDDPATVLATGRVVWVVNLEGEPVVGPLTIARSRSFHREWLVSFEGWPDRSAVEPLGQTFLAVAAEELRPPVGDEVYLDELIGFAVRSVEGEPLGLVTSYYEFPGGLTIEVQGPKREFLLPYRREMVREVDRAGRRLVVDVPEGL